MTRTIKHTQGMGLNRDEMAVLMAISLGESDHEITEKMHIKQPYLRLIIGDIKNKLNARTTPHMITRAFQEGVIKIMCVVLCCSMALDLSDQAARTRTRTRRSRTEYSRTARNGRREIKI